MTDKIKEQPPEHPESIEIDGVYCDRARLIEALNIILNRRKSPLYQND